MTEQEAAAIIKRAAQIWWSTYHPEEPWESLGEERREVFVLSARRWLPAVVEALQAP